MMPREKPAEQGRPGTPNMQVPRRAWGESCADSHELRSIFTGQFRALQEREGPAAAMRTAEARGASLSAATPVAILGLMECSDS